MASQALYLKWRPQRFEDVVGQQHVTTTLKNALQAGRISHAYLFSGPRGTGKTTITRYITYALAVNDASHIGEHIIDRVPVLIRVANYARAFEQDSTLHVIEYVAQELTPRPEFGQFLKRAVHEGSCLIIFDGLDEVADLTLRMRVTDQIQTTVAGFSNNQFLVTSRIVGYDQSSCCRVAFP